MRILILMSFLLLSADIFPAEYADTMQAMDGDTLLHKKPTLLKRIARGVESFIQEFNIYDTLYIEPQHHKFQAMMQMTNTVEQYTLYPDSHHSVRLSPDVNARIGPYVGYSLIFLGYTLQLNNLYVGNNKKSFNLSLYTSLLGADIFISNRDKFKLRELTSYSDANSASQLYGIEFGGFKVKSWGFNTYYIFNHRRHSYPAAYNQSTCQKHSAGSAIAGIGFGSYDMTMDWAALDRLAAAYIPTHTPSLDGSYTQQVKYDRYSLSGGYSYNWVFDRNWMLGGSATLAVSYNKGSGESFNIDNIFRDFKFSNIRLDGIGRMALVWNNTRFFAGTMAKIDSYTYSKSEFKLNNLLLNFNIYAGINFGKKKNYRTKGKLFEF